jgi:MoxR-like ATPase
MTSSEVLVGSARLPVNPAEPSPFVPGEQFYVTPVQGYLEKLAYGVANNLPVLLIGETGVGKTLAVRYLAWRTNNGLRRVNLNGATTVDEFLGKLLINERAPGVNGVLVEAMVAGDWILLDEINATLPEIAFCLHSLLDDDRMVVLMEYDGRIVRPNPNFRLFASMNPSEEGKYGGTKTLNEALLDRFPVVIRMDYLTEEQEIEAVMAQSGNRDLETVGRMVRAAHDVRQGIRNEKVFGSFSTRRVIDSPHGDSVRRARKRRL